MANKGKTASPRVALGEHLRAAGHATVQQWKSLLPADFWSYGREARREMLLAAKSMIDVVIEGLEGSETEQAPTRSSTRRKTKVNVEKEE